jgi:hypothetical protein
LLNVSLLWCSSLFRRFKVRRYYFHFGEGIWPGSSRQFTRPTFLSEGFAVTGPSTVPSVGSRSFSGSGFTGFL